MRSRMSLRAGADQTEQCQEVTEADLTIAVDGSDFVGHVTGAVGSDQAASLRGDDINIRGARLVLGSRSATLSTDAGRESAGNRIVSNRDDGSLITCE
jgi:hypothetical protein